MAQPRGEAFRGDATAVGAGRTASPVRPGCWLWRAMVRRLARCAARRVQRGVGRLDHAAFAWRVLLADVPSLAADTSPSRLPLGQAPAGACR